MGIYVLYDCALQDMKSLEDELIRIGSYYIQRSELLLSSDTKPMPSRDRQELVSDLTNKELEFQFAKVRLVQLYLECYEHITDPLD